MTDLEELCRRIRTCTDCPLSESRTHAVPGEGPADAEVMFIGEGPGYHEDRLGRPFVGPAGKFLEELLESVGLRREQVYITNVVKCRPPNNRDPLPSEIAACRKYLERQIALIQPRVIVTLGRHSLAWFFPKDSISKVHGQARRKDGVYFLHLYHPAAALHQPAMRETIEQDFQKLAQVLEEARRDARQPSQPLERPEQMRLF
ncbi:MAG: uracil-DNA glycosylase [Dehalococcoidia bacterium]|jgi:DNA polymerase|nr:uracil-DNA glycosylase [Dehalococcoidia bacterium]MDW8008070.1 uracil-DNA glycosylase [Chloroflexota bacterium]